MKKIMLAGCVIVNSNNEVLLLHRNTPKRTQWETPGGKLEENENPEKAMMREAKEELGVQVSIIKKLGQKDFVEDEYTMNYIWFLTDVNSGNPRVIETDKFDGLKYFGWDELKLMRSELSANAKNLVDAYFNSEIDFP